MSIKVKQLNWQDPDCYSIYTSKSVCGTVDIYKQDGDNGKDEFVVIFEVDAEEESFDTLDKAKRFAQTHHEKLVKEIVDEFIEK